METLVLLVCSGKRFCVSVFEGAVYLIPCRVTVSADEQVGGGTLRVTWLEVEIAKPGGRVTYRNGFVTDLDVTHDNVAEIAACGRARWKIENETFNVPETNGYNLEHNFGHGREGLANLLVVPDLPAFAAHTACDLNDVAWQRARRTLGARRRLFEHVRTITAHVVFPSWTGPVATPVTGVPPPDAA